MALITSAAASLKNTWGFSPQSIPGLQLWLDGADTSSITGTSTVTVWNDKSGNGYHMNTLPANGNYTSVYPAIGTKINGLNTVFFSAYAGLKQATTLSGVKNLYWVGRLSRTGTSVGSCYNLLGHDTFYDWHGGNYGTTLYLNSTFTEAGIKNATPVSIYGGNTAVVNTTFISLLLPADGTINMISAAGITDNTYTRYQGVCYDRDNQQTGWVGDLAEVIIFSQALTTAQHQQVEGYLAAKWGLKANLPATHPYSTGSIIPFNRPFYPTDIGGCSLWLDGADAGSMTFSPGTSNVTQWNDKSGNGGNATAVGTPTLSTTGTGVTLNGTNSCFVANTVTVPTSTHCLIAVHTPTTVTAINPGNTSLFRFQQTAGYIVFPYMQTANLAKRGYISSFVSGTNTIDYNNSTLLENSSAGIPNLIVANISSSTQFAYTNGNQQSSTTATMTSGTSDFLSIGAIKVGSAPAAEFYSGTISEMIIFNSTLTTAQRQQVEQYLAWKWGLVTPLPTGHPGKLLPAFGTAFTPKSLTGLSLWLDGADPLSMIISGSSVSTWNDKSGLGNSPTSSSGTYPTYSSTLNAVQWTGGAQQLTFPSTIATAVSNTSFTLFFVSQRTGGGENFIVRGTAGAVNQNLLIGYEPLSTPVAGWRFAFYGNDLDTAFPSYSAGEAPTLSCFMYSTTASTQYSFLSGSIAANASRSSSALTSWAGAMIGGNNIWPGLNANVYEVLIYNAALTIPNRQRIEGYLAWKWGLQSSLPSTHAYAKFSP